MYATSRLLATTVALLIGSSTAVALAQDTNAPKRAQDRKDDVRVDAQRRPGSSSAVVRASKVQGMKVKNGANKDLGSVKDIVIDVGAGQVKYAALSYGGWLGIGDKLFAVPWTAFKHEYDPSGDEHFLVLDIAEEALKKAPGFDQDKWPKFGDPKFRADVDTYYGAFRGARTEIEVGAGRVNVDVDVSRPGTAGAAGGARPRSEGEISQRAGDIIGMTVKNSAGKELGKIDDLVIGLDAGKVRYAALSHGGLLGVGDKLFAIPWRSLDWNQVPNSTNYELVLAIDESVLKNAPGFDKNSWPNLADPKFGSEIDTYYQKNSGRSSDQPRRND
jgi:sporulation protein YlmC with PRC-barrel domain